MKFKVNRDEFLRGINIVQGAAVSSKSPMPICSFILVQAKNNSLTLSAINLEIGIKTVISADVTQAGSICFTAKLLHNIVRSCNADINFRLEDNNKVRANCGKTKFSLHGLPDDEFPPWPTFTDISFDIPVKTLFDIISKINPVIPASANAATSAVDGALMEIDNGIIEVIGQNGYRIGYIKDFVDTNQKIIAIIPKLSMTEIKKILEHHPAIEDSVRVCFADNQAFFEIDQTQLFSRLLETHFPNIRRRLTWESDKIISINRQALYNAIKRVGVFADDKEKMIVFRLEKGTLTIASNNLKVGDANDQVSVEYNGESFEVGINSNYMLDGLNLIQEENVILEFVDDSGPIYLHSPVTKDFIYFMMPVIYDVDNLPME